MTATLEPAKPRTPPASPWLVVRELAMVEAVRLLKHPAVIIGGLISLVMMVGVHWGEAPVWQRVSIGVAIPLTALGLGSILAAADMALRLWRTEDSEAIDVLVASPRVRTAGQIAALAAPVLLAVTLQAIYLVYVLSQGPVGSISWWEIASGPAVVAVMAIYGLAAGRWFPTGATGSIAVLVFVAAQATLTLAKGLSWWALVPAWDMLSSMEGPPPELIFRPISIHVVYLLSLASALVCIALLRGRWRHGTLVPLLGVAFSLGAGVVLGSGQRNEPSTVQVDARVAMYLGGDAAYTCDPRGLATYCAYPGYEGWIDEWAAAVAPVLAQLPDAAARPVEIRQYPVRWMDTLQVDDGYRHNREFPYLGEDIRTGLWWGRGPGSLQTEAYPFGMALGVGAWAVGLPSAPPVTTPPEPHYSACHVGDQGRGVVAVWLAGQSSETAHQHIHTVFGDYQRRFPGRFEEFSGWIGDAQPYSWYRSAFSLSHFRYADQLLHKSHDEVASLIRDHWDTLTDPTSTVADAAEILGLDPIEWQPFDGEPDPSLPCP